MKPAKKSLGQHWLEDTNVLSSICDIADVRSDDTVLEIGPGHGSLTRSLLARKAKVIAVELDNDLADKLKTNIAADRFEIISQDILEFDLTSLPSGYKVVANIPYYLTSKLIRNLSESANPPQSITLLVQKEVAERLCAGPGSMSLLSVSAQAYYRCGLGPVVKAEKFLPPPKVDSQIVHMSIHPEPFLSDVDKKFFFRTVKAGFSSRRKTLVNNLSGGLRIAKPEITGILKKFDISPGARAQELSMVQWKKLTKYLTC